MLEKGREVCFRSLYVERETSLASLEREGGTLQGSLCSPLKSGGFGGTFECTWLRVESSKGLVGPIIKDKLFLPNLFSHLLISSCSKNIF